MPEFNARSDSVNVEQIMEQIRGRIREKRGVDYTEQQIRELAAVKLEKFLDPRGVRSDLLEEFRRARNEPATALPNYAFEDHTIFETHRAPVRWIRRMLNPVLKLFFNPNPLIQALHIQSKLNQHYSAREDLYFELLHNLVLEVTRLGIDVKNAKMRVESIAARLEFNERRTRALEGVVVYKPAAETAFETRHAGQRPVAPGPGPSAQIGARTASTPAAQSAPLPQGQPQEGPGQRSRRRRRRRGRRGGGAAASIVGAAAGPESASASELADSGSAPANSIDAGASSPTAESIEREAALHPTEQSDEPRSRSDEGPDTSQ